MNLATRLLAWYQDNKRDLPWREDKNPYKIWVSEVMLQQTRVEAVREYYERWLKRFPTPESLAAADEDEVLRYWQGLGYYSRARNLQKGVREVVAQYNGHIPEKPETLRQITGIGEYTAGAIASIAYETKAAAVDGNVLRVFSRLYCIEEDISLPGTKRRVGKLVEDALGNVSPGDFNQALMDLGATVCIPQNPRCGQCPLPGLCCAYQKEIQQLLPVRKQRTAPKLVRIAAGVLECEGRYLLRRRPPKGLLAGMWEFPSVEADAGEDLSDRLQTLFSEILGISVEAGKILFQTTHTFSHRQWDIAFYQLKSDLGRMNIDQPELRWMSPDVWREVSLAGPHCKMAELLKRPSLPL